MHRSLELRAALATIGAVLASALLIAACNLLPGGRQQMTLNVDGVPVTCSLNTSSIEGANTFGPGPEAETQCRARAREAIGTLLANVPGAQVQSVDIAANGATTVCFSNAGASSCQQVLPPMLTRALVSVAWSDGSQPPL